MKKLLLTCYIILCCAYSYAQHYSRTFSANGKPYNLIVEVNDDGSNIVVLSKPGGTTLISFNIKPFTHDQFFQQIAPIIKTDQSLNVSNPDTDIDNKINSIFIDIVANSLTTDEILGPISGTLKINPQVDVFTYKNIKSNTSPVKYDVSNIEIEVLEGFIENVTLTAKNTTTGVEKQFSNLFGIGFASKNNMSNLHSYYLFERDVDLDSGTEVLRLGGPTGIISYRIKAVPGRRDYSPKDDTYTYSLNPVAKKEVTIELRKDVTKRLLEARIYSDFVGISQDRPNGLIQTEVAKRINTNTNRALLFKERNLINDPLRFILGQGGGIFQYVIPSITLSKIEENNRRLIVHSDGRFIKNISETYKKPLYDSKGVETGQKDTTIQNPSVAGSGYVTPIDLLRYQIFSAGLDFNLLYSENVGGKFNFYLDGGIRFGRTLLRDSLTKVSQITNIFGGKDNKIVNTGFVNDFGVNTLQLYPELKMQWLPEERFGVTLSKRWTYVSLLNGELDANSLKLNDYNYAKENTKPIDSYKTRQWMGTWELLAFLKPSENGKLFFRYRLINELGQPKYNFHQIQIGYSFFILGNRKTESDHKGTE